MDIYEIHKICNNIKSIKNIKYICVCVFSLRKEENPAIRNYMSCMLLPQGCVTTVSLLKCFSPRVSHLLPQYLHFSNVALLGSLFKCYSVEMPSLNISSQRLPSTHPPHASSRTEPTEVASITHVTLCFPFSLSYYLLLHSGLLGSLSK